MKKAVKTTSKATVTKAGKTKPGAPTRGRETARASAPPPRTSSAKPVVSKKPAVEKTPPGRPKTTKRALPRPGAAEARERDLESRLTPPEGTRVPKLGDTRGKYVYCIVETTEPLRFGPLGLGPEPAEVHTINYRNIGAVVSDTPMEVLDPTRENVLAHERVNETVMRTHTVIPMSFGTVFKTREDIIELLRSAYDAFHDVLVKMHDKLEFGLKVLWDRDVVLAEIERDDEDVRRLKSQIALQQGSTYFARMQYGRLVDAALQVRSERYVGDIFAQLRDVAVASRANKPIGDKMIMNAAFLVSRDKEAAFDARVKEIGAKYDTLTFKYTGPWPPYNFVNVRLKLERAKDVE